jgi:DNA-binding NarL/FixJ family response regulator
VLIVDDHPMVREGLGCDARTQPDFEVVGFAGTGREALLAHKKPTRTWF